jgi:hypothetical protein
MRKSIDLIRDMIVLCIFKDAYTYFTANLSGGQAIAIISCFSAPNFLIYDIILFAFISSDRTFFWNQSGRWQTDAYTYIHMYVISYCAQPFNNSRKWALNIVSYRNRRNYDPKKFQNLTQCREYYMKQLCYWSKVGRSLGSTCGGQIREPLSCV